MKKKLTALLLATICSLSLIGCGSKADMTAATRGVKDDAIVYIADEAVALAGSVQSAEMTEAEIARAAELRAIATEALDLVNAQRAAAGLSALSWSDDLENCAQIRAIESVTSFSHTRPNGSDWYTVNIDIMWGENLAKGYKTAASLVDAWMASPTHAANILNGSFTSCSIAVYEVDGKLYFAQEFSY